MKEVATTEDAATLEAAKGVAPKEAAGDATAAELLRCDTCGKLTPTVSRVVVDADYNRANARPIYNCPECYEEKLSARHTAPAGPRA